MSNEKKTYSTVGTVTIGTDEYRDLIEDCIANEKDASDYRSKYWKEESRVNDLQKSLDAANKGLEEYRAFFAEVEGMKDKFALWKISKAEQ